MYANAAQLKHGSLLASLADLIPSQGGDHNTTASGPFLLRLQTSFFTGVTLLEQEQRHVGVLVHSAGKLVHAVANDLHGAAVLDILRADLTVFPTRSKRVAHPILMAASAIFDGESTASWTQLPETQPADLSQHLPPDFTGTVAWVGAFPHLSLFHGGRLFSQSDLPSASTPGPVIRWTATTPPQRDLFAAAPLAPQLSATAPPERLDHDHIWQATLRVYSKRLGRAADPAVKKLKKDLAGLDAAETLSGVRKRLGLAFGAGAVTLLEEQLKGERA